MQQPLIKYHLKGRCALVTGGASGIGLSTVEFLAKSGCSVAINYLPNDEKAVEKIQQLTQEGYDVTGIPHAIGDGKEYELIERTIEKLGQLDLLVNNAGTPATNESLNPKDLDAITDAMWSEVLDVNLVGLFRLTRAAASFLRKSSGAVVNLASVSALSSRGSSMAYAASKAGVISLTRHMAIALAPEVRVNGVAPGAVDSTWRIEWTDEQRLSSIEATPLKRRCTTDEIAESIVYLGFSAPMITGQTLVIDGGLIL
ncbi:SDR family NAD(P)-dependent oxidoreductase [Paenalcaligenes sp. Me131]|uniref:SDR family NAD(P)-dependent oxidoreductase n=1 Tax=Paenalcaligenes sp. Me131 TaxID=3392636 RepID=UPI003D27A736